MQLFSSLFSFKFVSNHLRVTTVEVCKTRFSSAQFLPGLHEMLNVFAVHCLSLTPVFCCPAWPSHSIFIQTSWLTTLPKPMKSWHKITTQDIWLLISYYFYFYATFNDFNFPRKHSSFTYYLSSHHDFLQHKLCLHSFYYSSTFQFYSCLS